MTPNEPYSGRTAPLTSKRWILCIYSINIGTEYFKHGIHSPFFPLTPNDHYSGLTAPLTSEVAFYIFIQQIIGTEYFKRGIYSPFFFSSKCSLFHNSNVFGSCIIHILYTVCAKIKKNNSGAKRLTL